MPKTKLGTVPMFLREIEDANFESPYFSSRSSVHNVWFAHDSMRGEIYLPNYNVTSGKYLALKTSSYTTKFYFVDHNPKDVKNSKEQGFWNIYNWYNREAKRLNAQIDQHNKLVDKYNKLESTGFKITDDSELVDFEKTISATVTPAPYPKFTLPIQEWLQKRVDEYNRETNDIVSKLENYNYEVKTFGGKDVLKTTKEYKRFLELKGNIADTDKRLTENINQLRTDVFDRLRKKDVQFDELSVINKQDNETIAQLNETLMENSKLEMSLQQDISNLRGDAYNQKKDLENLRNNFKNLQNLYNVSESKLKLNESNLENVDKRQDKTEESLTGIQKKLDDNSVMFANEKENLLREIKAIKMNTSEDILPRLRTLTSKLTALTQKHDAVKTELLDKLKEQQKLNQTQFEKLNAENEARGKQYEKDVSQLRRDLDVTRALADKMEDEAIQAQNAFQKQGQRQEEQEKYNKARFKVLFDYQTNVDRQIKIQEKKTTNFAQLKRVRVMPDKAKALRNFRRGRYALLEEFV